MRAPRPRFTIRRWMTVVGVVGVGLGLDRAVDGRHLEAVLLAGLSTLVVVPTALIFLMVAAVLREDRARNRLG